MPDQCYDTGGQKARISLARAIYSRASYLFLEWVHILLRHYQADPPYSDILSAVDAHTADHILNKCLRGPLLQDRTVLLVSHHVQLCLPAADYVVCQLLKHFRCALVKAAYRSY